LSDISPPLQTQKNNREIELIIKECILNAIRDSVPVEHILRAYMDETDEQDVEVKEVEEPLPDLPEEKKEAVAIVDNEKLIKEKIAEYKQSTDFTEDANKISFADDDTLVDIKGITSLVNAPKDEKNLEEIEKARALAQVEEEDDDEDERLTIGDNVTLDVVDINDLSKSSKVDLKPPVLDFEILT